MQTDENGIVLQHNLIEQETAKRAQALGFADMASYQAHVMAHPDEFYQLMAHIQVQMHDELMATTETLHTYQAELKASIEELQHANAAVLEREEYLRAIIDGASVAILTLDRYGFITSFNNFAHQLLGYDKAEVLGRPVLQMLNQQSKKDLSYYLSHLLARDKQSMFKGRLHVQRKDRAEIIADCSISPIPNQKKTYFAVILTDVTESVLYSQKTKQQNEKLQKANEALDELLQTIVHRLEMPVQQLLAQAQVALAYPEQARQHMLDIGQSAQQLQQVVNSLSTFTKHTRSNLHISEINLNKIVAEIAEEINQKESGSAVAIALHLAQPQDVAFYSDAARLKLILGDLAAFACRRRRPSVPLSIKLEVEINERRAILHMEDNAIDLPPIDVPRLFGLFYKWDEHDGYSGLSLFMVKDAVERLNGSIRAEALAGKGCSFVIGLPNIAPAQP